MSSKSSQREETLSTITQYQMRSKKGSFTLSISYGSIVEFSYGGSSGIICSTNESCYPLPGGADGAVGKAGGASLEADIAKLPTLKENPDWGAIRCHTGGAVMVGPGSYGDLKVSHVIFAVGPSYGEFDKNGSQDPVLLERDEQLRSAYRKALQHAREAGLEAIGVSLLSAGNRAGVHYERTLRVALEEVCSFEGYNELKEIRFCAYESFHCDSLKEIADELGLSSSSPNDSLALQPQKRSPQTQVEIPPDTKPPSPSKTETRYNCGKDHDSYVLVVVKGSSLDYGTSSEKAAVVCPTNESCFPIQGAVDGAFGELGGPEYRKAIKEDLLIVGENEWGGIRCRTGEARIIGPKQYGKLKVPYVIFAVGPTYSVAVGDGMDSAEEKDAQLRSAYNGCLELAKERGLEVVAFSLLSAGKRAGADVKRPLRIAMETIAAFGGYKELQEIRLYGYLQREADALNAFAQDAGLAQQE